MWRIVSYELENTHCLTINSQIPYGYRSIFGWERPKVWHGYGSDLEINTVVILFPILDEAMLRHTVDKAIF
jgi:hypothetical protein